MTADQFSTPSSLADILVNSCRLSKPRRIADFAAGGGALLEAARRRFPAASIAAIELDSYLATSLRHAHPDWTVDALDFLAPEERERSLLLQNTAGSIDLVLLNPPFSQRGGAIWEVAYRERTLRCGRALAFLATALAYVAPRGEVIAILPAGSLQAEKDERAWERLMVDWELDVLNTFDRTAFDDGFSATVAIRMKRSASRPNLRPAPPAPSPATEVILIRGSLQIHRLNNAERRASVVPLAHSTDLQDFSVRSCLRYVPKTYPTTNGPLVLLPRVGAFRGEKIALYDSEVPLALSDCVIALYCSEPEETRTLHSRLISASGRLEQAFSGTGAPYITLRRLAHVLAGIGYRADHAYLATT